MIIYCACIFNTTSGNNTHPIKVSAAFCKRRHKSIYRSSCCCKGRGWVLKIGSCSNAACDIQIIGILSNSFTKILTGSSNVICPIKSPCLCIRYDTYICIIHVGKRATIYSRRVKYGKRSGIFAYQVDIVCISNNVKTHIVKTSISGSGNPLSNSGR